MPRPSPSHAQDPALIALGTAIKRLRQERGLSQQGFAALSSIDRAYMWGIERGDQNIGLIMLMRVANALDLTLTELAAEAQL